MIVMKFGGTSVGSAAAIRAVAEIVGAHAAARAGGAHPPLMVVVSAASKVTDMLLAAARSAARGELADALQAPIAARERALLEELGLPGALLNEPLAELRDLLEGIRLLGELSARTLDRVASFGELMSSCRVAAHLSSQGVPSRAWAAWDLGMRTDSNFGAARVLPEAEALMRQAWERLPPGEIPVVTGFVGQDAAARITTLSRGGSDLSGSLFGTALGAEEIQIWTDVSGIMTCDPRVVPTARVIPEVSFEEASELAFFGAKVLHPRTIEPATRAGIPVLVKNTFAPQDPGTRILPHVPGKVSGPVGLAAHRGVVTVNINSTGMLESAGFLARVFEVFGDGGIPIDVIATSEVNVSVTVDCPSDALEAALAGLAPAANTTVLEGRSIVCLVGEGIKATPGIAGRVFTVLGDSGINVEMISQGASQINITFVVRDGDAEATLRAVHRSFFEQPTGS